MPLLVCDGELEAAGRWAWRAMRLGIGEPDRRWCFAISSAPLGGTDVRGRTRRSVQRPAASGVVGGLLRRRRSRCEVTPGRDGRAVEVGLAGKGEAPEQARLKTSAGDDSALWVDGLELGVCPGGHSRTVFRLGWVGRHGQTLAPQPLLLESPRRIVLGDGLSGRPRAIQLVARGVAGALLLLGPLRSPGG